ncbi:MAG: HD domain-containing protein [Lachnospiraceae bacterium]|nr:HD domain-containing protein [Lachnospiraceae bacterium]
MVWYTLLYYLVAICLIYTAVKAFSHKNETGNRVAIIQVAATFVILFYTVTFLVDNLKAVSIANSLYVISMDIFLITLLQYAVHCVAQKEDSKIYKILIYGLYGLAVVDIVLLAINVFHGIVLTYSELDVVNGIIWWKAEEQPLYCLHLAICYFCVLMIFVIFVKKLIEMPKLYRSRYSSSLGALVLIVFVNYIFQTGYISSSYGNISILLYGFGCMLTYWSTFDYTSKGMLNTIRRMILEYMDTPMILFDYEGYVADSNKDMRKIFPILEKPKSKMGLIDFLQIGAFKELQNTETDQNFEWYNPNENGARVYQCSFLCLKDEKGRDIGHLLMLRNVEIEKDALTQLYTKQGFWQKLQILEREEVYPVTVIVCNANSIGLINDVFGWAKGNEMLRMVADLLRENLPQSAFLARLEDGNMAAVFTEVEQKYAEQLFENIRKLYQDANDTGIDSDLEYGIAVARNKEKSLEDAYREAIDSMRTKKLMNGSSKKSSLMDSLTQTLTESDYETEEHVERTKEMAIKLGRALNLTDADLGKLALLAVLHDIGKIAIPHSILLKPGKLTPEEWEVMKSHTEKGYRIASASPELESIAEHILHHHERWDGNGYPSGLKGEDIPLLSRIITVVDSHDVMVHDRPYHKAMSEEAAQEELLRCSGTQFDPHLVTVFLEVINSTDE